MTTRRHRQTIRYGAVPNDQFLSFIGAVDGTVLDVGCGEGAWGPQLRGLGARRLIAVEPSLSADAANELYDLVVRTGVEELHLEPGDHPDLIIAADCLEHIVDRWAALQRLRNLAKPSTQLAISTPNFRSLGVLGRTLISGRFDYSDAGGIFDRGHLRWFTSRSLTDDLSRSGWHVMRSSGSLGRRGAFVNRITLGALDDILYHQLFLLAEAM